MNLGCRACAKELGISHVRLLALVREKRVPRNPDGSFNVEAVRVAFERTKDPAQRSRMTGAAGISNSPPIELETAGVRANRVAPKAPTASSENMAGFNEVRTKREAVKLKEAELDLAERQNELMPVEDARRAWSGFAEAIKSRALLFPSKVAPKCVGQDMVTCQMILEVGIKDLLTGISEYQPNGE